MATATKAASAAKKTTRKTTAKKTTTKKSEAAEIAKQDVLSSFVFMDKTEKILDISMATGKNCILYGKGGYGKSEFTLAYLRQQGIEPYVITMGSGMTIDRLFGGVDLAEFNKTGKIEYLIENSFMNHEYVIFEELFDAPDFILEQLKDILSSRVFRNGGQVFEIKTKLIICATNKTRKEFAKNNSLKALMERFPLELEVKWDDHNQITYTKLLEAKYGPGSADPMLTYILEGFSKKKIEISPRIALVAADVIDKCGPECLQYIAEFGNNESVLKETVSRFKSFAEIAEISGTLKELTEEWDKLKATGLLSIEDLKEAKLVNGKIHKAVLDLSKIKADDSLAVDKEKQVKHFKQLHADNKKFIDTLTVVDELEDLS